jgi:hypothetical protein
MTMKTVNIVATNASAFGQTVVPFSVEVDVGSKVGDLGEVLAGRLGWSPSGFALSSGGHPLHSASKIGDVEGDTIEVTFLPTTPPPGPAGGQGADSSSSGFRAPPNEADLLIRLVILEIILFTNVRAKTSRDALREWVIGRCGDEIAESIKKTIPLNAGRTCIVHFQSIRTSALDLAVRKLQEHGTVRIFDDAEVGRQEAFDNSRRNTATAVKKQVGDVNQTQSFLQQVMHLRGDGGKDMKRRRFAEQTLEMAVVSQRVATSGLREAKAETEGDEN